MIIRKKKKIIPKKTQLDNSDEITHFLIQVPVELKAEFKIQCAMNRTSMKNAIIKFMGEYLD